MITPEYRGKEKMQTSLVEPYRGIGMSWDVVGAFLPTTRI